ncbi:MAG: A/G-specific adenine glycosylase [Verrucomicrobiota bacterium]|jgi:A/G-specific adenine glycosylase|nr:A/G-specific adenine glycosylase [Verrucomicrobiota bacterium]MDK2962852.1 A/G-specific adenine glycosylase [Verrucomicrobiota bacterium]
MSRNAPEQPREKNVKKAVISGLLPWFDTHRRDLPWRRNRTPYRVWVAEIMLQQTRVDTVIAYYRRWMKAFPSWRALARAPQSDVLKCWEGLGYYSRARNLHAAAKIITDEYKGNLSRHWKKRISPATTAQSAQRFSETKQSTLRTLRLCEESPVQALQKMPGVGAYTAAAIASLAFNEDAAVVDGNVIRVLSRLFAFGGDTKDAAGRKQMQARADELLVEDHAADFNESMMELGALVCLPKNPQCAKCPLRSVCAAFAAGTPDKFPVMKKKKKVPHIVVGAAVTVNRNGEVLIAQRREGDMLAGLWEFPGGKLEEDETIEECIARELKEELGLNVEVGEFLMTVKHAYSHFTMTMHVYYTKIISGRPRALHCACCQWVRIPDLGKFAYSKADLQVVTKLEKRL